MFIYNGKVFSQVPKINDYNKSIKVSKEDILLTFISSEARRNDILFTFSITYFNVPVDQNSYIFERMLDKDSLEKAIFETIGKERTIDINVLKTREVIFSFNIEKWINFATSPMNISKRKGIGTYYIKPTIKFPDMVIENINPDISSAICKKFTSMLASETRFSKAFKGSFPKEVIFQQHKYLDFFTLGYNLYNNRFEANIRNDLLQVLYFSTAKGKKTF